MFRTLWTKRRVRVASMSPKKRTLTPSLNNFLRHNHPSRTNGINLPISSIKVKTKENRDAIKKVHKMLCWRGQKCMYSLVLLPKPQLLPPPPQKKKGGGGDRRLHIEYSSARQTQTLLNPYYDRINSFYLGQLLVSEILNCQTPHFTKLLENI